MTQPVTLASLANTRCWVAWQTESRKLGDKPTKVPYAPAGYRASANKPSSWGTREAADKRASLLPRPYGAGGVGLEFTTLPDGRCTGGIDLDSCRDPLSGTTFDAADYLTLPEAPRRSAQGGTSVF